MQLPHMPTYTARFALIVVTRGSPYPAVLPLSGCQSWEVRCQCAHVRSAPGDGLVASAGCAGAGAAGGAVCQGYSAALPAGHQVAAAAAVAVGVAACCAHSLLAEALMAAVPVCYW